MKTITGTYVWSTYVEVQVPDNATDEQQREALDREALKLGTDDSDPILHECSNEDLVD